jgi:hypothetical protein
MEQFELLHLLVQTLERLGIAYQLTDSTATITLGEPRFTNDIDVVVDLRLEQVSGLAAAFPAPEFYFSSNAAREAVRQRGQFNVIHPTSGLKIDFIILPDNESARSQWQRTVRLTLAEGVEASFIAAEDVILRKMEYYQEGGSEKHLRDIAGVLKLQEAQVDRRYIEDWAGRLGLAEIWQTVLQRLGQE